MKNDKNKKKLPNVIKNISILKIKCMQKIFKNEEYCIFQNFQKIECKENITYTFTAKSFRTEVPWDQSSIELGQVTHKKEQ